MSQPTPRTARALLARYASARIALAEKPDPARRRELAEVVRALREATGTHSVAEAIAAADEVLASAKRAKAGSRAGDGLVAA
ncbi:DUF5133 domain-containing protein [Streptomyces flavofungini]|uniref:DUF5133 domain-containing protein n=1 Tax=Streptomyces flavofungini TaxID=68200 RepID=UPI0034DFE51C